MRVWFGGPRILGVRTGVSFGPEDFRRAQPAGASGPQVTSETGFVYVIAGDHGRVKVGSSLDPMSRIATLQTGSPFPLRIPYCAAAGVNYEAVEKEAHSILAPHNSQGEWFSVPVDMAVAAINAAAFRLGSPAVQVPPENATALRAMMANEVAVPNRSKALPIFMTAIFAGAYALLTLLLALGGGFPDLLLGWIVFGGTLALIDWAMIRLFRKAGL